MKKKEEGYIENFTRREEKLMKRVTAKGLTLPPRLADWRQWIGDSQVYLNELKNFVDTH